VQARLIQPLRKTYWRLHVFGLTPARLPLRVANAGMPRMFCTSIPKAGTNLVVRALCLHPRLYSRLNRTLTDPALARQHDSLEAILASMRPGQVVATHLRYSADRATAIARSGVRHVFVVRDPRDVMVSTVFYVLREKNHYLRALFAGLPTLKQRLALAIRGHPPLQYQSIGARLADSSGWLAPPAHTVRFEDIVGTRGGGSDERQLRSLRSLMDYVGAPTPESLLQRIAVDLFSEDTRTFRTGRIGQWREHFDDELKSLFREIAGEQLIRYGYERSHDW
jgi:hypothetical protein